MRVRQKVQTIIVELMLILLSLTIIVPLLLMILGSFMNNIEVMQFKILLPEKWLFEKYVTVFKEGGLARAFVNGVVMTVISCTVNIVTSSAAAFILARRETKLSSFLYLF